MLTRLAHSKINGPIPCRGCDKFFGFADSFGLCSSCSGCVKKNVKSDLVEAKKSMKRCNVQILSTDHERMFKLMVKEIISNAQDGLQASNYLACGYLVLCTEIGHRFVMRMDFANTLSQMLYKRFGNTSNYFVLSKTLACFTFMPWTIKTNENGWDSSTTCYCGNLGEVPSNEETYDKLTKQTTFPVFGSPFSHGTLLNWSTFSNFQRGDIDF